MRLGHTLGELGTHKEAAAELRQAIDARPDGRRLYLAELFLGREEEALGRRDEADGDYERAARLVSQRAIAAACAQRARAANRRSRKRAALAGRVSLPSAMSEPSDPWWEFYQPHKDDADVLMARMRQIGR